MKGQYTGNNSNGPQGISANYHQSSPALPWKTTASGPINELDLTVVLHVLSVMVAAQALFGQC